MEEWIKLKDVEDLLCPFYSGNTLRVMYKSGTAPFKIKKIGGRYWATKESVLKFRKTIVDKFNKEKIEKDEIELELSKFVELLDNASTSNKFGCDFYNLAKQKSQEEFTEYLLSFIKAFHLIAKSVLLKLEERNKEKNKESSQKSSQKLQ